MSQFPYPPPSPQQPLSGPPQSSGIGGFFTALFDFNFRSFVTPHIVKLVYIIATVLVAFFVVGLMLTALGIMVSGDESAVLGFLLFLAAPVIGLVYLAFARMSLELYYAVIRLSEDVHRRQDSL